MYSLRSRAGSAKPVCKELLASDLGAPGNRHSRQLLADEAGHGAAFQA